MRAKMVFSLVVCGFISLAFLRAGNIPLALFMAVVVAGGIARELFGRRRSDAVYDEVAKSMGLRRGLDNVLEGEVDGFAVAVEERRRDNAIFLRVVVDGGARTKGPIPGAFSLRREGSVSIFGPKDVIVGDEAFDEIARVEGRPEIALALFGSDLRQSVSADYSSTGDTKVENGKLVRDLGRAGDAFAVTLAPWQLEAKIREAVRRALDFTLDPEKIPSRLAANATTDPDPAVRRRNTEILAAKYWTDPAAAPALRKALGDSDRGLRFLAARTLGEEGYETLLGLLVDSGTDEGLAARVLDHMAGHFPPERVLPFAVRKALSPDGPLRISLLKAIGTRGDSSYEERVLESLGRDSDEVRLAAVEALGRVGTAAAVVPLKEVVSGRPLDLKLRRAVERAVGLVQGRLEGAGAGQVSLSGEGGGEGRVSLAGADEEGRLSLPREGAKETGP